MKKINLSITILCIIEIICCFTPFCLDRKYWEYERSMVYHGISTVKRHDDINIFRNGATLGKPLAILFVCAAVVVAVIYFIKMFEYLDEITSKAWLFSIVHTVIMWAFLFYSCAIAEVDKISYRFSYGINWMFYIIIALNLIILALSILLKFGNLNKLSIKKQIVVKEQKESLDELLAYKELLDSGVISQKEFDEKKRQLLGL